MSRGALVESEEDGRIRAMLPADLADSLSASEWLSLDLRPRPGADDARSMETMPEKFLPGSRAHLQEAQGVAVPDVAVRLYPAAAQFAKAVVRKHVTQTEENANRRLARDTERVESYYEGLLAQLGKRTAKRANDAEAAEKERSRARATEADRVAKLEDLRRKYSLRIQVEPAALLAVRVPVRQIAVRLIRKREERAHVLHWNPILHALESPLCEHCSARAHPLYLCEPVHLLCGDSWTHCPGCSLF